MQEYIFYKVEGGNAYRNTKFTNITETERVNLYNEIWADPVQTVAKRYDMSDTALRKHCKRIRHSIALQGILG